MRMRQYAGLLASGGIAFARRDRQEAAQSGAMTAGEAQRRNDAAAMFDRRSASVNVPANEDKEPDQ